MTAEVADLQLRVDKLAPRPDGNNRASMMSYAHTLEASEESALYGSPDEIATNASRSSSLMRVRQSTTSWVKSSS